MVLAVLIVEGAGLALYRASTGRGPTFPALLPFLGAGCAFAVTLVAALALRSDAAAATMTQAASIGLPLVAAFLFHVWDLKKRW